jgi:hypothetical protein
MDDFLDTLIKLGKSAASLVPGGQIALDIAEKVSDLVDAVQDAPAGTQEELRDIRKELRAAVSAKAQATANRLDG